MCTTTKESRVAADTATTTSSAPNKEESSEEAAARRAAAIRRFSERFSAWSFFDPSQPWVLVDNGSFLGYFDWVPQHLRVGPWSIAAICYLTILWYLCALGGAYFYSDISHPWWPSLATATAAAEATTSPQTIFNFADSLQYPAVWMLPWFYHVVVFGWMNYISYLILSGPNGYRAWATYTVQSWTLLTVRHGLCAAAPYFSMARAAAELIRFPAACSSTITFTVWNFALMPFIYFVGLKTPAQRKGFLEFAFSFRLANIHIMNIIFCFLNCGPWGSPRRQLEWIDFYMAGMSLMVYMGLYLLIMDRLGVHTYPIFSPRAGTFTVVFVWTFLMGLYLSVFFLWKNHLMPLRIIEKVERTVYTMRHNEDL